MNFTEFTLAHPVIILRTEESLGSRGWSQISHLYRAGRIAPSLVVLDVKPNPSEDDARGHYGDDELSHGSVLSYGRLPCLLSSSCQG